jgi:hypothetical protein
MLYNSGPSGELAKIAEGSIAYTGSSEPQIDVATRSVYLKAALSLAWGRFPYAQVDDTATRA